MANALAFALIGAAVSLRHSHTSAPAIDVLDLVMKGRKGHTFDFTEVGVRHGSLADPASDFGQIVAAALDQGMTAAEWVAFTKESLREFLSTSIVLPATVVSDGLDCFTVAKEMGMAHDRTVTGGGRDSVEVEEHWAINTILGNLKTAMTGTCHAIKFAKYVHPYLAEVQYRFNRRYDLRAILPRLVRAVAVTPAINESGVRAC